MIRLLSNTNLSILSLPVNDMISTWLRRPAAAADSRHKSQAREEQENLELDRTNMDHLYFRNIVIVHVPYLRLLIRMFLQPLN